MGKNSNNGIHRLFALLIFFFMQFAPAQDSTRILLFIGSYTDDTAGEGIHVFDFNPEDGSLKELHKVSDLINASFLALSHNGKYLYSVTESKLEQNGSVSAFAVDSHTGQLTFLNKQTTNGRNPAHLNVHESDKFVVSANYTDAVVNLYECEADGSLTPSEQYIELTGSSVVVPNQNKAHAHSSNFSSDGEYLYVMDLGSDKINAFKFDQEVVPKLTLVEDKSYRSVPGSGPRHFAFHPNGKYGYCINELNGTVTSFAYNKGLLSPIDNDFSYQAQREKYNAADIHVTKDGKFLYASNRGENTLSIFKINEQNGSLFLVGHEPTYGDHPRSFVIDPTDNYLLVANQISGNIVVFRRNVKTGKLIKTDSEIQLKAPASLKMKTY